MKTRRFLLLAAFGLCGLAHAQGTFQFSNATLPGRPRVVDTDGVTPLTGDSYLIDVLVKNPVTGLFSNEGLQKVTVSGNVPAMPVKLLTGAGAGLFSGGTIVVPFVAPGEPATLKVRLWDTRFGGPEGLQANIVFDIAKLGGSGTPPTLPAPMSNFTSFGIILIPEPATGALLVAGSACLVLLRRR